MHISTCARVFFFGCVNERVCECICVCVCFVFECVLITYTNWPSAALLRLVLLVRLSPSCFTCSSFLLFLLYFLSLLLLLHVSCSPCYRAVGSTPSDTLSSFRNTRLLTPVTSQGLAAHARQPHLRCCHISTAPSRWQRQRYCCMYGSATSLSLFLSFFPHTYHHTSASSIA